MHTHHTRSRARARTSAGVRLCGSRVQVIVNRGWVPRRSGRGEAVERPTEVFEMEAVVRENEEVCAARGRVGVGVWARAVCAWGGVLVSTPLLPHSHAHLRSFV